MNTLTIFPFTLKEILEILQKHGKNQHSKGSACSQNLQLKDGVQSNLTLNTSVIGQPQLLCVTCSTGSASATASSSGPGMHHVGFHGLVYVQVPQVVSNLIFCYHGKDLISLPTLRFRDLRDVGRVTTKAKNSLLSTSTCSTSLVLLPLWRQEGVHSPAFMEGKQCIFSKLFLPNIPFLSFTSLAKSSSNHALPSLIQIPHLWAVSLSSSQDNVPGPTLCAFPPCASVWPGGLHPAMLVSCLPFLIQNNTHFKGFNHSRLCCLHLPTRSMLIS